MAGAALWGLGSSSGRCGRNEASPPLASYLLVCVTPSLPPLAEAFYPTLCAVVEELQGELGVAQ